MKKLFSVLMIALMLGAFVSCNKNDGKAGKDDANKAHDDSITEMIATYFGGQMALEANDTAATNDFDLDEFLRGFNEAYEENVDYAKGKKMGADLAQNLEMFEQQFKIKIDREKFLAGFIKAAKDKKMDDAKLQTIGAELQKMMMAAMYGAQMQTPDEADEAEMEEAPEADAPQQQQPAQQHP
ncbi:MAG: hypothetical protein J6X70_03760 [Muribaculaceae bacterium]|nr:hypothetical protein [Muribaculaceae bacterium]